MLLSPTPGVAPDTTPLKDAVPSVFKLRLGLPVAVGFAGKNLMDPSDEVHIIPAPLL